MVAWKQIELKAGFIKSLTSFLFFFFFLISYSRETCLADILRGSDWWGKKE